MEEQAVRENSRYGRTVSKGNSRYGRTGSKGE